MSGGIRAAEAALVELESQDEITTSDLEAFKRALPTDPETARVVDRALPFPWSMVFEFVEHPATPYWRAAPPRDHPNQVRAQEDFAAVVQQSRGVRGTVERDGREVQLNAAAVGDALEGRRVSGTRVRAAGQKALRRLREVLDV